MIDLIGAAIGWILLCALGYALAHDDQRAGLLAFAFGAPALVAVVSTLGYLFQ